MANRTNLMYDADRLARWQLVEIGRELRLARITSGRTQAAIAAPAGTSVARISRLERGLVPTIKYRQLVRIAAIAGLRLHLRAYPTGRRLLDAPQLALFADLRGRANPSWRWQTEVPMPVARDLRAMDAVATVPGCVVAVELWTRLADWQAQSRAALLKQRDLSANRLVVVLRDTRANREALRQAGPAALDSFPMGTRAVLRALAEGSDPGANGVAFL